MLCVSLSSFKLWNFAQSLYSLPRLYAASRYAAIIVCLVGATVLSNSATGQSITVINPGGEEYPINPEGNLDTNIDPGGFGDISVTGWNSTVVGTQGRAVQGLDRDGTANSGAIRLAFGATAAHVAANPTETSDTAILFQETSQVVAAGQEFVLNFFGRGFFDFQNATDDQASFFGYVDGGGTPIAVDTKNHTNIISGVWTQTGHSFIVPNGSPLIGENLTIGFFTQAGDGGGFSAIDDVTLMLGSGNSPGDANGDGVVNFADVQLIATNFLNTVTVSTMGDLDDNAVVDFADYRIWKDDPNNTAAGVSFADAFGAPVPEPGAICLVAMASITLLSRRDRRAK